MKLFSNHLFKSTVRIFAVAGLLIAGSLIASAQTAGYDLLQTGSGASVDLSNFGLGSVPLQGVPIQTSTGNTDTIMHRTANGPGSVPVNVYALFMKNSGSVSYGGNAADVYITINNSGGNISTTTLPQPDTLTPSTGTVTIGTSTFDSRITINADVIIVRAGTGVNGTVLKHGTASAITLTSTASPWSSTPPPGYPSNPGLPSGGFYPRPSHTGPHPVVPASCGTSGGAATLNGGANGKKPGAAGNAIAIAKCVSAI